MDQDDRARSLQEAEEMLSDPGRFVIMLYMIQDGKIDFDIAMEALNKVEEAPKERFRRLLLALHDTLLPQD